MIICIYTYSDCYFNDTQGDIRDLGLTFSISDESYGAHKEIELFPGNSLHYFFYFHSNNVLYGRWIAS